MNFEYMVISAKRWHARLEPKSVSIKIRIAVVA
jgi:hypothetical protein